MAAKVWMTKSDLGLLIGLAGLLVALGLTPALVLVALVSFMVGRAWR
jgi:hypothetical protein